MHGLARIPVLFGIGRVGGFNRGRLVDVGWPLVGEAMKAASVGLKAVRALVERL
jgi:hypothetical protein